MPFRIRDATVDDAADIARVHVASWRTTYAGIVPDEHLRGLSEIERAAGWRKWIGDATEKHAYRVALDEHDRVIGFAAAGPARDRTHSNGELFAIYLLREHQRGGVGRALVASVREQLARHALTPFVVWVLAANPSRGFYERLAGRPVATQDIELGGARLVERAYVID